MTSRDRLRVLLVSPTALDYYGRPIRERRMHLPGLTLPMLAAVTPPEVDVRLVFDTVEEIPYDDHWDLVGLTSMGSGAVRAWQIADEFRKRGTSVVIGGIAAGISALQWTLNHADSVVMGEAEELWPQVIRDFESGRLRSTYQAQSRPDMGNLPVPRYDLMNKHVLGFWRPVQATRGCPHTCNFCSVTAFFEGTYRKQPVDHVLRDVREAKKYGSRYIAFIDDNIGADLDYCAELWEALIPERIIWMSQSSLQISERPDMMKLAHRSGCRMLSFGIESLNSESLEFLNKGWNRPERYREAIKALRKHGIEVSTEMIIGVDGDDESVFDRVAQFILQNGIVAPRVHILTPVPGTPLYAKFKEDGRLLTDDFTLYTGSKVVFRPLHIEAGTLQKRYWELYERIFSWPAILRRIVPNRAHLGPYMTAVVWAVNLRYRRHIRRRITPGIL